MSKETSTIRITKETKDLISNFGNFGDNYNDCILNLFEAYKKQADIINTLKQKIQSIQKKHNKVSEQKGKR